MTDPEWIRCGNNVVTVSVWAQPNAKTSEIVGVVGQSLKVKIASPAVDGAANESLLNFLAEKLGLRRRNIRLLQGLTSRKKVVEIHGVTQDEVSRLLMPPSGE